MMPVWGRIRYNPHAASRAHLWACDTSQEALWWKPGFEAKSLCGKIFRRGEKQKIEWLQPRLRGTTYCCECERKQGENNGQDSTG